MATKAHKEYNKKATELGCIPCRNNGFFDSPATLHHIREGQGMAQKADWWEQIPLCPIHHQYGDGTAKYAGQYAIHHSPAEFKEQSGEEVALLAQTHELIGFSNETI